MFEPVTGWEKVGQVPNVVFVEGLVLEPRRWRFYYGGADKFVGAAALAVKRSYPPFFARKYNVANPVPSSSRVNPFSRSHPRHGSGSCDG